MDVADASFKTEKLAISFGLINVNGLLTPAGETISNGIPSITISGLLLAFSDAPPRILILGAESGLPPLLVITKPATFPASNSSEETILPLLKSLSDKTATAPVASFLLTLPYPITTTSSSSEVLSKRVISMLARLISIT